jgi:hypothetical protein
VYFPASRPAYKKRVLPLMASYCHFKKSGQNHILLRIITISHYKLTMTACQSVKVLEPTDVAKLQKHKAINGQVRERETRQAALLTRHSATTSYQGGI